MKVHELNNMDEFELLSISKDTEITGVFCCDLLSIAMGKAPAGSAWVTVMANVNTLAVASLTDVACIILAEDVTFDNSLIDEWMLGEIEVKKIYNGSSLSGFDLNDDGTGSGNRYKKKSFEWYKNVIASNGECLKN